MNFDYFFISWTWGKREGIGWKGVGGKANTAKQKVFSQRDVDLASAAGSLCREPISKHVHRLLF